MTEEQPKLDLAGLIADIAREECRKLYERRLAGLEEELSQSENQTWHDGEDWLSLDLQYLTTTTASPLVIDGQAERLS